MSLFLIQYHFSFIISSTTEISIAVLPDCTAASLVWLHLSSPLYKSLFLHFFCYIAERNWTQFCVTTLHSSLYNLICCEMVDVYRQCPFFFFKWKNILKGSVVPSWTIWWFILFYSVIVLSMHDITVCVLHCPDCIIFYAFLCWVHMYYWFYVI